MFVYLYNGQYKIDRDGTITSFDKLVRCSNGWRTVKGKTLKHRTDGNGYKYVTLYDENGVGTLHRIHRLIMMCFNYQEGCESLLVNHLDGTRDNNAISNLEWTTHKGNAQHAVRMGLTGKENYSDYVEVVLLLRNQGWSNAKIGRALGKTSETIGSVLKTNGVHKSQKGRIGGKFRKT